MTTALIAFLPSDEAGRPKKRAAVENGTGLIEESGVLSGQVATERAQSGSKTLLPEHAAIETSPALIEAHAVSRDKHAARRDPAHPDASATISNVEVSLP